MSASENADSPQVLKERLAIQREHFKEMSQLVLGAIGYWVVMLLVLSIFVGIVWRFILQPLWGWSW